MASNKLVVALRPANMLARLSLSFHLLCIVIAIFAPVQLQGKIAATLILGLSLFLHSRFWSELKRYNAIEVDEGGLRLFQQGGQVQALAVKELYLTRFVVVITYRKAASFLPASLVITPQSVPSPEGYRQLYIALKQLPLTAFTPNEKA
ncbi:hypothetical protein SAMN02745866_02271 [Alteromonadaceae bacterium Bs31]|nr:hypothetical protein SAMN02745866_02271 [Alteromonadaceae bacterium Bs31]